jgi:lipoate-protein ligase B
MDLVDLVHHELARETLVFCTHPPVVTLGRATREGDVFGFHGSVVEVNRGGRATFHGPGQIVAYPILDLNQRNRDIHQHLRSLEHAVVLTLAEFGIEASGRTLQVSDAGGEQEATGVWIGSKKIASVGIGVRNWVSYHGVALNVEYDKNAFGGIKPCGFSADTMTSMEEILGSPVAHEKVQECLKDALLRIFGVRG